MGKWYGTAVPILNRNVSTLFIYCNFVDYSIVNESTVPILCQVGIPADNFGKVMEVDVQTLMYIKTAAGLFQHFEFDVYDDAGVEAKFLTDRFTLQMEFRPKS